MSRSTVEIIAYAVCGLLCLFILAIPVLYFLYHRKGVKIGACQKYNVPFIVFGILCVLLGAVLLIAFTAPENITFLSAGGAVLASLIFHMIYYIPYLVANANNKKAENVIYTINFLLGWTVIAWIVSLILAFALPARKNAGISENVDEQSKEHTVEERLERLARLYQSGVLTEEEYKESKEIIIKNNK